MRRVFKGVAILIVLSVLAGCGSSGESYRITPVKDYNGFVSDFDFLDSSTKDMIGSLIKEAVDWYNTVEIPEDYSGVNLEILDSAPFLETGKALMKKNEEKMFLDCFLS